MIPNSSGIHFGKEIFIDKNGLIRERHVGVIDEKVWKDKFAKYLDE